MRDVTLHELVNEEKRYTADKSVDSIADIAVALAHEVTVHEKRAMSARKQWDMEVAFNDQSDELMPVVLLANDAMEYTTLAGKKLELPPLDGEFHLARRKIGLDAQADPSKTASWSVMARIAGSITKMRPSELRQMNAHDALALFDLINPNYEFAVAAE